MGGAGGHRDAVENEWPVQAAWALKRWKVKHFKAGLRNAASIAYIMTELSTHFDDVGSVRKGGQSVRRILL